MIYFYNKGNLDLDAIRVSGLNAKEGNNPIGYFGTGLKYAISIFLRLGHDISLFTNGERYDFYTKNEYFRGKEFQFIYISSAEREEKIPFTTEYGKNWEPWMAFRELYTNALDEGGGVTDNFELADGDTIISVNGKEVHETYAEMHKYFLQTQDLTPIYSSPEIDVYDNLPDTSAIFNKGILVQQGKGLHAMTYNVKQSLKLTEDRFISTYDTNLWYIIVRAVVQSSHEGFIERFIRSSKLSLNEQHMLGCLSYISLKPSDTFTAVYKRICQDRPQDILQALAKYMRKTAGLSEYDENNMVKPDAYETQMLEEAKAFMRPFLPVDKYEIRIVETNNELCGFVEKGEPYIYINRKTLHKGKTVICQTLMEEVTHIETGYDDGYDMQVHYLKLYIGLLEQFQYYQAQLEKLQLTTERE